MGTTQSREFKISWILERLTELSLVKKKANIEQFVAKFAYENSCSRRLGLEIIKMLQENKELETDGQYVWIPWK